MFDLKDFEENLREGEISTEIDLSPLLALMVTLIPMLLLQTSFITLKMLETNLPILSDRAQEEQKNDKEVEFDLNVFLKNDNSVVVETVVNKSKVESKTFKSTLSKEINLDLIQEEILKIKTKYPEQVSAKITPENQIKYTQIVKVLDVMRKTKNSEYIRYKDKKGKAVETAMLFPDIIFGNISD